MTARVLIVGVGGLGCPASLALARAGEGAVRLTLADPDRVDASNLHRQLWFRGSDVGQLKVTAAADRLRAAFPKLEVATQPLRVDPTTADALYREHDLVIDATDGAEDKFALSDASVRTGTPLVYGGVIQLSGQAMVIRKGGPCLRCLFETPPSAEEALSCAQAGVLGSMAGVIGGLQALLGLAELKGGAAPGVSTLHVVDGRSFSARQVTVRKAADCASCGARAEARG
ncbi:MAG TPA: HesA/MoeB/ThiF family protein [Myxococcales bacterium]|nr:HesA/MoeB/ThiF family protein [Myxococcales bacterium]